MLTATPAKLRSGEWGARVAGQAAKGDTIQITTRAGKAWTATVSQVVWSGDGVTLVATESSGRRQSEHAAPSGMCTHCGEHLSPWAQRRGFRSCVECAHGGHSYYDSRGRFVLGSDD